jgi:putative lipoic acid-binding regulatory protein
MEQNAGDPEPLQFGGAVLDFPISFDLRIIYTLAEGESIAEDLERIFGTLSIPCSLSQSVAKPGAKYGRMGSRIRLSSREQMYALYEAVGALPYVKTVI